MSYADVNGINLYYEEHGTGEPLVLLHGGLGATGMFGPVLPALAVDHRVIAVDLQGHGRTADVDRPIRIETLADDIAALVRHLGLARADVMGYSFGGAVALRTAIQHPDLVRRLVVASAPFAKAGWHDYNREGMDSMSADLAETMKTTPMYETYAQLAPRIEDWPRLLDKMGDMMRLDYDWSDEVRTMVPQTLIVVADADSVRTSHAVAFYELLGGNQRDAGWDGSGRPSAQLAVLPNLTHYTTFSSPELARVANNFLTP